MKVLGPQVFKFLNNKNWCNTKQEEGSRHRDGKRIYQAFCTLNVSEKISEICISETIC